MDISNQLFHGHVERLPLPDDPRLKLSSRFHGQFLVPEIPAPPLYFKADNPVNNSNLTITIYAFRFVCFRNDCLRIMRGKSIHSFHSSRYGHPYIFRPVLSKNIKVTSSPGLDYPTHNTQAHPIPAKVLSPTAVLYTNQGAPIDLSHPISHHRCLPKSNPQYPQTSN